MHRLRDYVRAMFRGLFVTSRTLAARLEVAHEFGDRLVADRNASWTELDRLERDNARLRLELAEARQARTAVQP